MKSTTLKSYIGALRELMKITLDDLSEITGISLTNLKMIERGLAIPSDEEYMLLASCFSQDLKKLIKSHQTSLKKMVVGEGYSTRTKDTKERIIQPREQDIGNTLRVMDLFCGAGGLSFGFEQSNSFTTVAGLDLLQDRIGTFVENHPHAHGIIGDIRKYSLNDLSSLIGKVDVIVGGPPCQGFSSIRPFRTLTEGDSRNSLVENYVLFIDFFKPKWFLFENVVGILTHANRAKFDALLEGLKLAGYDVDWRVLNAALYGAPQSRERVVIVGNREGIKFNWPKPTHFAPYRSMAGQREEIIRNQPGDDKQLLPAVTLMEAISDLSPVKSGEVSFKYLKAESAYQKEMRKNLTDNKLHLHKATTHSDKLLEIIRHSGKNIYALPPGMVKSGFSSCYSRLDPNKPSTTMTVNFNNPGSNRCIHPFQDRALTPREGARLQTFPDDFKFVGTTAQITKQIGNAVPPLLGKVLAESIIESINADEKVSEIKNYQRPLLPLEHFMGN